MVYPSAFVFFVFLSSVEIQDGLLSTVRLAASVGAGGNKGAEYRLGEYALRDATGRFCDKIRCIVVSSTYSIRKTFHVVRVAQPFLG